MYCIIYCSVQLENKCLYIPKWITLVILMVREKWHRIKTRCYSVVTLTYFANLCSMFQSYKYLKVTNVCSLSVACGISCRTLCFPPVTDCNRMRGHRVWGLGDPHVEELRVRGG